MKTYVYVDAFNLYYGAVKVHIQYVFSKVCSQPQNGWLLF